MVGFSEPNVSCSTQRRLDPWFMYQKVEAAICQGSLQRYVSWKANDYRILFWSPASSTVWEYQMSTQNINKFHTGNNTSVWQGQHRLDIGQLRRKARKPMIIPLCDDLVGHSVWMDFHCQATPLLLKQHGVETKQSWWIPREVSWDRNAVGNLVASFLSYSWRFTKGSNMGKPWKYIWANYWNSDTWIIGGFLGDSFPKPSFKVTKERFCRYNFSRCLYWVNVLHVWLNEKPMQEAMSSKWKGVFTKKAFL